MKNNVKNRLLMIGLAASLGMGSVSLLAEDAKPVGITADKMSVTVKHAGQEVEIRRNQDNTATVGADFAKTSRPCPPFCIQPDTIAPGVETIAELGMLGYLEKVSAGDKDILVIDSRTSDWVEKGTIPGSINIPWDRLASDKSGTEDIIKVLSEAFGVKLADGKDTIDVDEALASGGDAASKLFDYSGAKTLVMFCNGMWCGQSPTNIKTLLRFGYPADKLKWYRGGMQDWSILGLTTVKPGETRELASKSEETRPVGKDDKAAKSADTQSAEKDDKAAKPDEAKSGDEKTADAKALDKKDKSAKQDKSDSKESAK